VGVQAATIAVAAAFAPRLMWAVKSHEAESPVAFCLATTSPLTRKAEALDSVSWFDVAAALALLSSTAGVAFVVVPATTKMLVWQSPLLEKREDEKAKRPCTLSVEAPLPPAIE
jgi:hypothetical protein